MTLQSLQTALALPEIFVASMASAILIMGLFINKERNDIVCFWLSVFTLLAACVLIVSDFATQPAFAFNGLFVDDPMGDLLKVAICLLSATIFIYGRQYNQDRNIFKNEYYVLGLFAVCGMMVMASANHLLTLYLGLELMSLCLYSMIAFFRDDKLAVEAAMKYFVLGALASSVLLYGMSLLYGLTGALELAVISSVAANMGQDNLALALAVVFIVVALAFKIGAVPFHMWIPDVYHGAATSTTAFIGAAPKIAAFALIMRLLVGGLEDLHGQWQQMLIILALLSVAVGNVIAIAQNNLKRMLAYSTISHMGFFLFGILAGSVAGYSASLFYILIYATMSCAAFGLILYLSTKDFESDQLNDLKGLSKRSPFIALLFLILMFSMAGVPPTAGFFAKLSVIQALIDANLQWVAIVAVVLAVIGAYYYLRIIKLVYFDAPQTMPEADAPIAVQSDRKIVLAINVIIIIAILPWIGALITLCNQAIKQFAY
ncbi:NADH-quinone oxidoreductase subunit NuoN [Candidatus Spongiihabitans sp.]|uniref:NADH-quinone oxidoreductase subunit NuoN n=1 Tax=Candidatus Spongiihabitans sp. TaxID=3101308 RepID=UPI003C79A3DA